MDRYDLLLNVNKLYTLPLMQRTRVYEKSVGLRYGDQEDHWVGLPLQVTFLETLLPVGSVP
jgi:hypothetical protein